ncbi:MAG: helix-turn-helix transcriptional regulator [Cyanosarcina radialis HA8281-LM2]|jgi:DNA-binding Xre family transcriptional regulator|nr:helix-turn-helix transcriptional regulator [Cyanosarcina radialis HA8281-LM2]
MAVRNKIKDFIEFQGISVYQFRKLTGISNATAYALTNKPDQYPSKDVMDKICSAFKVQPSDLLEWLEDNETE